MAPNGSRRGESDDMDSRVAKWLTEALKWACVVVPLVVYQERRFGSAELRAALEEERDKTRDQRSAVHESRLDRLDASSSARLDVGLDGGFGNPNVRGLINGTIREQTRHLATRDDLERFRAEQAELIRRFAEVNALKPAH